MILREREIKTRSDIKNEQFSCKFLVDKNQSFLDFLKAKDINNCLK